MAQNKRIEQLKTFLKDNPNDTFLNYALATEYVGIGDDEDAKMIFLSLIEREPDYSPAYYHLGQLYERHELLDDARRIYEKGVDICRRKKEQRNLAEMQTALNNLMLDE